MKTCLVIYHSRTGNTKKIAEAIEEGLKKEDVIASLKSVEDVNNQDLLNAQCIGIGSPTYSRAKRVSIRGFAEGDSEIYFRTMSSELKKVVDESIDVYGKLDGKKGFVFTSSGTREDGEKCLQSLFEVLDCHGIEVLDRFLAVGEPSREDLERCVKFGKKLSAKL